MFRYSFSVTRAENNECFSSSPPGQEGLSQNSIVPDAGLRFPSFPGNSRTPPALSNSPSPNRPPCGMSSPPFNVMPPLPLVNSGWTVPSKFISTSVSSCTRACPCEVAIIVPNAIARDKPTRKWNQADALLQGTGPRMTCSSDSTRLWECSRLALPFYRLTSSRVQQANHLLHAPPVTIVACAASRRLAVSW